MKKKILSAIMILATVMSLGANATIQAETAIEAGDSLENAVEIGFDTEYVGNIETIGEEDWYKFTAPEDAYYFVDITSYTDEQRSVLLCTEYEKPIVDSYYRAGIYNISKKLEKSKIYCVKVYSQYSKCLGKYSIKITYKLDNVGDTYDTALPIKCNEKQTHEIDGSEDADWFCFKGDEGQEYQVCLTNISAKGAYDYKEGKDMTIYDSNMKQTLFKSVRNIGDTIEQKINSKDLYYIKVTYGGSYQMDNRGEQKYSLIITKVGEEVTPQPQKPAVCTHDSTSKEAVNSYFEQKNETNHTKITNYKETCDDCGVVVSEYSNKNDESHNFSGNSCYNCNYVKEIVPEKDTISPEIYEFYCDTGSVVNRNQTSTITFTARARDNVGVARISLVKNYLTIAENTGSSLTATIQTDGLSLGQNDMYIIAYDAAGNYAYSDSIYITVTENTPSNNGEISVYVDGQKIYFDVPPQIINNRTMVPIRAIFEAMGATVEWDGTARSVLAQKWYKTGGIIFVRFYIDSNIMYNSFGSGQHTIDSPATIIDGRTLVPARAAAESFDYNVSWDEYTRTVYITSK